MKTVNAIFHISNRPWIPCDAYAPRRVSTSYRQLEASCIYGPLVSGPQVTLVMASLFCHVGKQFLVFTVTPSKIKIETNQCIKSRIYERKEHKHAKIQVRSKSM